MCRVSLDCGVRRIKGLVEVLSRGWRARGVKGRQSINYRAAAQSNFLLIQTASKKPFWVEGLARNGPRQSISRTATVPYRALLTPKSWRTFSPTGFYPHRYQKLNMSVLVSEPIDQENFFQIHPQFLYLSSLFTHERTDWIT